MKVSYKFLLLFFLLSLSFSPFKTYAQNYWLGTDATNPTLWNVAANWSLGAVPIAGDLQTATFSNGGGGNNNPCNINVNATCDGIQLMGAYSSTVTVNSTITVTTDATGIIISSGTFDANTSAGGAIAAVGGPLTINGGTFIGPNDLVTIDGAFTFSSGTCTLNGSTFTIGGTLAQTGGTFTSNATAISILSTATSSAGTFNCTSAASVDFGDALTLSLTSNFTATANITTIAKGFAIGAATFTPNGGTVEFLCSSAAAFTIGTGITFYNLKITHTGGTTASVRTITIGTTVTVTNDLTITIGSSARGMILNTGTIELSGNLDVSASLGTAITSGGSATINLTGTTSKNLVGNVTLGAGRLPNINVSKSSGTLSLSDIISVSGNWTNATTGTGTIDATTSTSTIALYATKNFDGQSAVNTMTLYDFTIGLSGTAITPVLTGNLNINGTLTVNTSSTLNVNSQLMTFKSTASVTSRIGNSAGAITNATTMAYERYIPGTVAGWIGLGNPATSGTFQQIRSKIKIACPTCDDGDALGFYSIQYYAEASSGWAHGAKLDDDNITNGKGYFVWCDDGLDNTITTTSPVTLTLTGSPKTGTTDLAPTLAGNGWNLLANPYPSPISWNALEFGAGNRANISDTKYVYDADQNGGAGDYIADVANGSSVTTEGGTDVIPAFQAFFVLVSTTAPTLNCTEAMKVSATTSSNPTYLKTDEILNSLKLVLHAPAHSRFTAYTTATEIQFASGASKYFNLNEDAMRLEPGNGSSIIFTSLNDTNYAINKQPELSNDVSIPVMVRGFTAEHSISISDYTGISEGSTIILEDLFTKTKTNLRTGDYSFSFADTTSIPRFLLHISASVTGINTHNPDEKFVNIGRNDNGVFVQFNFDQTENATISAFNTLGQKVMEDMNVEALNQKIAFNLDMKNAISYIKVQTSNKVITKKIYNY